MSVRVKYKSQSEIYDEGRVNMWKLREKTADTHTHTHVRTPTHTLRHIRQQKHNDMEMIW